MINLDKKRDIYSVAIIFSIAMTSIGLLLWTFDFEILFFIQNHIRNSFLDAVVPFYTNLGNDGIIWIVVGLVMLIPKKTRKCGIMVLGALLVMVVFNNLFLKNVFARPRPCATYPEMVDLVHVPTSYSFPSGHTVSAMAVAFTILTQHKKLGIITLILAFLMGLTRLYVFVHFPTDVYCGIIVGAFIAIVVWYAEKKITPIITEKLTKNTNKKPVKKHKK